MRKYFILLFVLAFIKVDAQSGWCVINFEDNQCPIYYTIDTTQIGSIWNICTPNKPLFDSAYSVPKAILTDSSGTYPINDTSSFIIKTLIGGFDVPCIGGMYKMDCDSLHDFGIIEISIDHGQTWHNLLSDTVVSNSDWYTQKPIFTGRIKEWTEFLTYPLSNFGNYYLYDTLLTRFTFISDSMQTNRDGWILDDIKIVVHTEGIPEFVKQNNIVVYPNPTKESLFVKFINLDKIDFSIKIYDIFGRQVFHQSKLKNTVTNIDIHFFDSGTYFYELINNLDESRQMGKFIIDK